MNNLNTRIIEIDINDILPSRFQPRIKFDENEILELTDSIKEYGVIQPIVVREIGDKYEIIAGERRYKACVLAGKETVPVIVRNLNDKESSEIALLENIQRKNLTPIEEALSYKRILDMGYLNQSQLASKLGKSQSSIANKIRLLNLTDEVQEALLENKISERHARSLLKLSDSKLQNDMLDRIIKERLTVRKADDEIEKVQSNLKGKEGFNMFDNSNSTNSFDMFGGAQAVTTPNSTPSIQPAAPQVEASMPSFGAFVQPVQPQAEASMPSFDTFTQSVQPQPIEPMPSFDTFTQPVQPQPVEPMPSFDAIAQPAQPQVEASMPSFETFTQPVQPQPVEQTPAAPSTAPIVEQGGENSSVTMSNEYNTSVMSTDNMNATTPVQEPIIITDYSKQYDPIMPQNMYAQPQKVDFKEVINAIRECSKKIEQYGYKIDLEEYDLANLYQVVFKVEK